MKVRIRLRCDFTLFYGRFKTIYYSTEAPHKWLQGHIGNQLQE